MLPPSVQYRADAKAEKHSKATKLFKEATKSGKVENGAAKKGSDMSIYSGHGKESISTTPTTKAKSGKESSLQKGKMVACIINGHQRIAFVL